MKFFITLILIFNIVNLENLYAANERGKTSMLEEKPYLTLRIEMTECIYDVQVNGISILFDAEKSPITVNLPINQWLRAGENEFSMYLYTFTDKPLDDTPECSITLLGRNSGEPEELNKKIMQLSYIGRTAIAGTGLEHSTPEGIYSSKNNFILDSKGDTQIGKISIGDIDEDGGKVFNRKVKLPLNLPQWAFFSSDVITDDSKKIRADLFPYYKKIQDALISKNVASIISLLNERNTELDAAFYYETGTYLTKIKNSLVEAANDSGRKILDLEPRYVGVELFNNKKLVRLVRSDGDGAIVFNYVDGSGSENYDLVFRKSGEKWILTR